MKRHGQSLSVKEIEETFLKKISKSGIVAYYIYNKKEKNIISILNKQEQREKAAMGAISEESGKRKIKKEMVDDI